MPIETAVKKIRRKEMGHLGTVAFWLGIMFLLIYNGPIISSIISLVLFAIYGKPSLASFFSALNIFFILRFNFTYLTVVHPHSSFP
jgi:hypothetical protein